VHGLKLAGGETDLNLTLEESVSTEELELASIDPKINRFICSQA